MNNSHNNNDISFNHTILILAFTFLGLTACNQSREQKTPENTTTTINYTSDTNLVSNDTVVKDLNSFPLDTALHTKILTTGWHHEDEVWEEASELEWFGLFKAHGDFYLKHTKVKTKYVNNPVIDESENEKSGIEVTTDNKDTALILIEPLPFLKEINIQALAVSGNPIFPGNVLSFKFLGIDYKIFATGGKRKVQDDPDWFYVWNYKLYLTAKIKGKEHKSLLVAHPNFDDQITNLIFAGDIDGDKILDLIIENSNHYNATKPTIFLSRPAVGKEVVKPMGEHTSVGC